MTNNPTIDGVSRLGTCEMIQALLDLDARGSLAPHGIGGLARDVLTKAQTTIARLEARVAELESGRGDPVAWRFRVSSGGDWFTTTKERVAGLYRGTEDGGEVEPLFTAPPAPVAVVLPERLDGEPYWSQELDPDFEQRLEWAEEKGWNACLDATAALNGLAK